MNNKLRSLFLFLALLMSFGCKHEYKEYGFNGFVAEKRDYRIRFSNEDWAQYMDIRYPSTELPPATYSTDKKIPAHIYLHGGFWLFGDSEARDVFSDKAIDVSVNYRLTGLISKISYREMIDDILKAVQYLKDHSEELHIDTSKMTIGGFSAGGHLALLYAYMATDGTIESPIPVVGVVSDCGPADFTDPSFMKNDDYGIMRDFHMSVIRMVTGGDVDIMDGFQEKFNYDIQNASPYCHISANSPPSLLLYGGADEYVPTSNPDRLEKKLAEYNVQHVYHLYPGETHGCYGYTLGNEGEVADFVNGMLGL